MTKKNPYFWCEYCRQAHKQVDEIFGFRVVVCPSLDDNEWLVIGPYSKLPERHPKM